MVRLVCWYVLGFIQTLRAFRWARNLKMFGIDAWRPKSHPKATQKRPKNIPGLLQECRESAEERQDAPKNAPRAPRERPRAPQERPKSGQKRPKSVQERPKRGPEGPQSLPEHLQGGKTQAQEQFKSRTAIFQNSCSRVHGSRVFGGRSVPGETKNCLQIDIECA